MAVSRKRPALLWYTGDWLKDPHLSMCSPATRGIWMDALCLMHENGESGVLEGTVEGLARACRCSPSEMSEALEELVSTGTVPPIFRQNSGVADETVTLENRRMMREAEVRKSDRERKMRERERKKPPASRECPENVTLPLSVTSSVTSSSSEQDPPTPPEGGAPPDPIKGLELFEKDPDLLKRWSELWARWKKSFPDVDLEREILAAHEHQMEAPPAKRRKSKARFLGNWFRNSEKFAKRDADRDAGGSQPLDRRDDWLYGNQT